MARFVKWSLAGIAGLLLLTAMLAGAVWWALDQGTVRDWALDRLQTQLKEGGISLSYSEAKGDLLHGLELRNLRLTGPDSELFSAERATLQQDPGSLLHGQIKLKKVELVSPLITLPPDLGNKSQEDSGAQDLSGFGLIRSFVVQELIMKDWRLEPGPAADPLSRAEGDYALASVVIDRDGFRMELKRFRAKALLNIFKLPLEIKHSSALITPAGLSDIKGLITCGGNQIEVKGSMGWRDGVWFKLSGAGSIRDYAKLPLDWFWPNPPASALGYEVQMNGRLSRLVFKGGFKLQNREQRAQVTLDLYRDTAKVLLKADGLDLPAWGLNPEPLSLTGEVRADLDDIRRSVKIRAQADLSRIEHKEHGGGSAKLKFDWPAMELSIEESDLATPWASLKLTGSASLDKEYRPLRFKGQAEFRDLVRAGIMNELLPRYLENIGLNGVLRAQGNMAAQELRLELQKSRLRRGWSWTSWSCRGRWLADRLQVDNLDAEGEWGHLWGSGFFG